MRNFTVKIPLIFVEPGLMLGYRVLCSLKMVVSSHDQLTEGLDASVGKVQHPGFTFEIVFVRWVKCGVFWINSLLNDEYNQLGAKYRVCIRKV